MCNKDLGIFCLLGKSHYEVIPKQEIISSSWLIRPMQLHRAARDSMFVRCWSNPRLHSLFSFPHASHQWGESFNVLFTVSQKCSVYEQALLLALLFLRQREASAAVTGKLTPLLLASASRGKRCRAEECSISPASWDQSAVIKMK